MPYRPGSRLRRALDIARGSAADEHGPVAVSAPVEVSATRDPSPATASTTAPPESADADDAASTGRGRTQVRAPGSGRGLDALFSPVSEDAGQPADTWESAAQGWVQTENGELEWRPIVTTVDRLDQWSVATYLGIVSGEVLTPRATTDADSLARGRGKAVDSLVARLVARGGHAAIGVKLTVEESPDGLLVTATGTAVTLSHRR